MKDTISAKDRIIEVTTGLIEQHNGNTKSITARMIAEKSGVGLGLINYHFGSKDNLITTCVQRIIGKVIEGFETNKKYASDKERLTAWAINVFDFLFEHKAISRISILGDFQNYTIDCNSVHSQRGFMIALKNDIPDKDKRIISFIITAAMQVAFLASETVKELLGYDFKKKENRASYIEKLVSVLFEDNRKEINYE